VLSRGPQCAGLSFLSPCFSGPTYAREDVWFCSALLTTKRLLRFPSTTYLLAPRYNLHHTHTHTHMSLTHDFCGFRTFTKVELFRLILIATDSRLLYSQSRRKSNVDWCFYFSEHRSIISGPTKTLIVWLMSSRVQCIARLSETLIAYTRTYTSPQARQKHPLSALPSFTHKSSTLKSSSSSRSFSLYDWNFVVVTLKYNDGLWWVLLAHIHTHTTWNTNIYSSLRRGLLLCSVRRFPESMSLDQCPQCLVALLLASWTRGHTWILNTTLRKRLQHRLSALQYL